MHRIRIVAGVCAVVAVGGLARAQGPTVEPLIQRWTLPSATNDFWTVSFGNLDGDGVDEVIGATFGFTGIPPEVVAVDAVTGAVLWSTPLAGFIDGALALGDVDGDTQLDIVIPVSDSVTGSLYVLNADGTVKDGWPVTMSAQNLTTACLADLNPAIPGLEIIVGRRQSLSTSVEVYDGSGTFRWSRSTTRDSVTASVVADLDGDQSLEVVTSFFENSGDWDGTILVSNANGSDFGTTILFDDEKPSAPTLGDLNNDGQVELVVATAVRSPNAGNVYVFRNNGAVAPGWPNTNAERLFDSPALADVDNDGDLEIFSRGVESLADQIDYVYGWNHNGTDLPGWPAIGRSEPADFMSGQPRIVDLDMDGEAEIVVATSLFLGAQWRGGLTALNADGTLALGRLQFLRLPQLAIGVPAIHDFAIDTVGIGQRLSVAVASGDNNFSSADALYFLTPRIISTGVLPWPHFYQNPQRTGAAQ